jgi:N6-L-threonylcarbamoyladenine synthase
MALVVSGGHTALYRVQSFKSIKLVATTTDDACGEAFDKVAKVLGLSYPGGPQVAKMAAQFEGETDLVFMQKKNYKKNSDFSYSGLKTAVLNYVNKKRQKGEELNIPEICFAFQREAIGQLVSKVPKSNLPLAISGGVAANEYLRKQFPNALFPSKELCGDNAAMIGAAAILFDKNLILH